MSGLALRTSEDFVDERDAVTQVGARDCPIDLRPGAPGEARIRIHFDTPGSGA